MTENWKKIILVIFEATHDIYLNINMQFSKNSYYDERRAWFIADFFF